MNPASSATTDVAVIGAGAAGLLAAMRVAEGGRSCLLLEKTARAGTKILMSGGTRCNVTHATDRRGIVTAFGKPGRFLNSALAALGPDELLALLEAEGVSTKVEETGKVFPVSNKARDVLNGLLRRFERSGAQLSLGEPVQSIERRDEGRFVLVTPRREIVAARVIVTTGGRSYPGSGTTGDGYAWAERLGHTLVPRRPALVPLTTRVEWVRSLMGLTLADVGLKIVDGSTVLDERRGGFLFAHFGLSGPAVLDVSRAVASHPHPSRLLLRCDFLPDVRADQFDVELQRLARAEGRRQLLALLTETVHRLSPRSELPRRMMETALLLADVPADRKGAELSAAERQRIVQTLKSQDVPLTGTLGYEKAEVTAGGVSLEEVDSRTLESRLVPGLYFAGEILDLDGPIGGYNFQSAFSTGWLAGDSAVESLGQVAESNC